MIPKTLITYIETAIIPRYKEFDKAHNLSHVRTVIEESLALARQYPEADERLAYVIAAYHDTGHRSRPHAHSRRAQGNEALFSPCRCVHSTGKGYEL